MATRDLQAEWAWWRQVETIPELAATKFQDANHKPRCTCAECQELAAMIEGGDA